MRQTVTNCMKNYPFTTILVLVVWYLSLFTPPRTSLDEISFIDKWAHIGMYGMLTGFLWLEYIRAHRRMPCRSEAFALWLCPALMGGIIELVQEYCTQHRSGDWLDFAANALGAALGAAAGYGLSKWRMNR